ncbi:MAG: 5'-3' exonuclease H3TH domain-containing protein [Verrucomicrobiota bacterium]
MSIPTTSGRLLLVDAHALAYRSFYGIRNLKSAGGMPTNAIYGFIKALDRMRAALSPTHWMVIWDGGLAAERLAALPEYKAQRPPMPDDLRQQLDGINEYLDAAGIVHHCEAGEEADDRIATVTRLAGEAGLAVVIASPDKDFLQLVADQVGVWSPNDKSGVVWGREQVVHKTGVPPEQIVDWLSLVGDAVDNIPGVPGVGPKTAAELLCQYGKLEALYATGGGAFPDKLRASLSSSRELVFRNRQLVRLNQDLPGEVDWRKCMVHPPDTEALQRLFERWDFKSMSGPPKPLQATQAELFSG